MKTQRYRIRFIGRLDAGWSSSFSGMLLTCESDGMTSLSGPVADPSALHGVLAVIRDLNLSIVSVLLLDADGLTPVECGRCRAFALPANKPENTSFDR
jgi:hypothetical protein